MFLQKKNFLARCYLGNANLVLYVHAQIFLQLKFFLVMRDSGLRAFLVFSKSLSKGEEIAFLNLRILGPNKSTQLNYNGNIMESVTSAFLLFIDKHLSTQEM